MWGQNVIIGVAHPWSERKGLKDYIALSQLLPENVVILLVGLGKEQQLGLPNNIIGLGLTQNREELAMLYSMADIVMNLSYAETFGLTTVEGFACGTPGIVYDITASPELITPDTGIVVESGNVKGVAEAVALILRRGKQSYAQACRKRAIEFFDNNICCTQYVSLYKEMLN